MESDAFIDYYAFLMISPQADRAMIEWAARLMLTRYGAKNPQTADPEKHELVKTAYRTLVDSQRKAAYDKLWQEQAGAEQAAPGSTDSETRRATASKKSAKLERREGVARVPLEKIQVEFTATLEDARAQRRLRQAVVSSLYDVLVTRPRNPELGRAEIARAVGCRVDDLEFSIWFLRERELIKTSNSGLYAITSAGVEWVESGGVPHLSEATGPHIVPGKPATSAAEATPQASRKRKAV